MRNIIIITVIGVAMLLVDVANVFAGEGQDSAVAISRALNRRDGYSTSATPDQMLVALEKRQSNTGNMRTASSASPSVSPTSAQPARTSSPARNDSPLRTDIHEADHEGFLFLGGHYNFETKTKGAWVGGKTTKWWGFEKYPFNLGAGLSVDSSFGKTASNYRWAYVEPGVNVGAYWFGEENDLLARLNFAYRVPLSGNNTGGFVPGAELQFAHAFSNRLALIAQIQGKYFRKDSHGNAALVLEYLLTPEFRLKAGLVADLGFGGDSVAWLLGPTASIELDNRYVLGINLFFGPGGTTIGPFVGFKYTKYLKEFDKNQRETSVVPVSPKKNAVPLPEAGDVKLSANGDGSYGTLGWANDSGNGNEMTLAQFNNGKKEK